MDVQNLYDFLLLAQSRDERLIVMFDGGDSYHLANIDFCFSTGADGSREDEPLKVNFAHCLNDPSKRSEALSGDKMITEGVWWTSTRPFEPVGMSYEVDSVVTVWDDMRNYHVYERQASDLNMEE